LDFNTPKDGLSIFQNNNIYNLDYYQSNADQGLARVSKKEEDMGKFRIPSLRNVAVTAPYMHDGSMENLSKVIQHYANCEIENSNLSRFVIMDKERTQLISFLETLTDSSWNQKKLFNKPIRN
jgi:cytochrome c peroxidase